MTGKCVLNMDHYCPWMSNCVGYYNYRYFVLFLAFMSAGCLYVVTVTLVEFQDLSLADRYCSPPRSHARRYMYCCSLSTLHSGRTFA